MLKNEHYSEDEIEATNLFIDKKCKCNNRFCFPVITEEGNVAGLLMRRSNNVTIPIWLNLTYQEAYLGANIVTDYEYVIVCEGPMDVIACLESGYTNVIMANGVLTDDQLFYLKRFNKIIFAFDKDECGKRLLSKYMTKMTENNIPCEVLDFAGLDVYQAYKNGKLIQVKTHL